MRHNRLDRPNKKTGFFIVGAAKSGTTTLHNLLAQRPDMSLPAIKESNYFAFKDRPDLDFKGPFGAEFIRKFTPRSAEAYQQLFDPQKPYWAEACPSYLFIPSTARTIHEYNPDARIVIILRNPANRAFSNYLHLVRDGAEQLSFSEAIAQEKNRASQEWSWFWQIVQQGYYFEQVKRYLDVFRVEQVKIIRFEELSDTPVATIREIEQFFGIPEFEYHFSIDSNQSGAPKKNLKFLHQLLLQDGPLNKILRRVLPLQTRKRLGGAFKKITTSKAQMDAAEKRNLQTLYAADLKNLSQLTDMEFSNWLDEDPSLTQRAQKNEI